MDLNVFLDNLNEYKDTGRESQEIGERGYETLDKNMELWQEMCDILNRNKKFEGEISNANEARTMFSLLNQFMKDISKEDTIFDKDERSKEFFNMRTKFKDNKHLIARAEEVFNKLQRFGAVSTGNKNGITKEEEKEFFKGIDIIEAILFDARFYKRLTKKNTGSSKKIQAFPIEVTSRDENHYGIIYYPSGVVCWEGMISKNSSDQVKLIRQLDSDPDVKIPKIFPLSTKDNTLLTNAPVIRKMITLAKLKYDDSDEAKTAVKQLFIDNGAVKLDDNGIPLEDYAGIVKKIDFWKGIKKILDDKKK
jgi:hypothetical protein